MLTNPTSGTTQNVGAPDPGALRRQQANSLLTQIVITSILVAIAFGAGWFSNAAVNQDRYISDPNELLIHQAWQDITQKYVVTSAINEKQMAYDAISAMTNSLGDTGHSRFETPEEYAAENNSLNNGANVGIGVSLSGGGSSPVTIEIVYPGSNAAKAGLKAGDQIDAINGQSTKGMTLDQVSALIRANGTNPFTMTITRPSAHKTFTVTLRRGPFTVPTVETFYIPGTTLVDIQLTEFATNADSELRRAIQDAMNRHVTGIIFDLRGDPGGLLDQAVEVKSDFVPYKSGENVLIVKTRTTSTSYGVDSNGLATTDPAVAQIPLVILVDNGTASAAEITTGAIKVDRPDVHVVGQTTFGTGTVLYPLPLADGSVLLLGLAEFYLPNGQSIYHHGFVPDQQVKLPGTATPLTPLVAASENLTAQQVQQSGDTQLLTAIKDLSQ